MNVKVFEISTTSCLNLHMYKFIYFNMYNLMMATMMAETCSC